MIVQCILNRFEGSENLSHSLHVFVYPSRLCGHLELMYICKQGCTEVSENPVPELKCNYDILYAACDKKCHSERQTLIPLFGKGLGTRLVVELGVDWSGNDTSHWCRVLVYRL